MSRSQVPDPTLPALTKLSIVIPARDEEGCIASTVEHLHVELRLQDVPHEIVVVDDGSTDRTWDILEDLRDTSPSYGRFKTKTYTALVELLFTV